jgi:hypothetical protein
MRLRGLRRVSLSVLFILSLALATAVQFGPAARSAAAFPPFECKPQYADQTYTQWLNSEFIKWRCAFGENFRWWWVIQEVGNDDERENWERYAGGAIWQSIVQSAIGESEDHKGLFVGAYELRGPSGSPIERLLAVHLVVQYNSGGAWHNCSDTGWKQSPRATSQWQYWFDYSQYAGPKCGNHTYRVASAGRFLSVSTGQWVTNAWVYSGNLGLGNPV